jgi:GxxExxY protein
VEIDQLTYAINGAVFEVKNVLGYGFLEKVYENALLSELNIRGIKAESQVAINVMYKGSIVGEYYADLIVQNKVVLELKSLERLQSIHEAQILNYLTATRYQVGLLVNFTFPKAEIKTVCTIISAPAVATLSPIRSSGERSQSQVLFVGVRRCGSSESASGWLNHSYSGFAAL